MLRKRFVLALLGVLLALGGVLLLTGMKERSQMALNEDGVLKDEKQTKVPEFPTLPITEGDKQVDAPMAPVPTGVYEYKKYGFKVTSTKEQTLKSIECPFLSGDMAYNGVADIVFTRREAVCNTVSQDPAYFYQQFGLVAIGTVYNLSRCENPTPDKKDADGSISHGDVPFCDRAVKFPNGTFSIPWKPNDESMVWSGFAVKNDHYLIIFEFEDGNALVPPKDIMTIDALSN